jgi:hypothetical protein
LENEVRWTILEPLYERGAEDPGGGRGKVDNPSRPCRPLEEIAKRILEVWRNFEANHATYFAGILLGV